MRHLLALQAVVEQGSFRAAADRLGYTQPSVSAQIAALEQIVGAPLLERRAGRPVHLTQAGEAFYGHAVPALARLEAGGLAASRTAALDGDGALRFGTFPSAAGRFLVPMLGARDRPAVRLELFESGESRELEALVMRGELDLTLTVAPFAEPEIVGVALTEDPYVLLAPAAIGLADGDDPPTLEELAGLPLIAAPSCASIAHLEGAMRLRGLEPTFAVRTNEDRLTNALVAGGAGVAVLGRMQVDDPQPGGTVVVGLGDLLSPRLISVAWHPDRPLGPGAQAVVARLEELARTSGCAPGRVSNGRDPAPGRVPRGASIGR